MRKRFHLPLFGLLLAAAPLNATTISYSDLVNGSNAGVLPAGLGNYTTTGGTIRYKTVQDVTGAGVSGGYVNGEIDASSSEAIVLEFASGVRVSSMRLAFLYPRGQFNDAVDEQARIIVNGSMEYLLTATGFTTCSWTGSGICTNLQEARQPDDGLWRISNPFGGLVVNSIAFTAVVPPAFTNARFGDYSFVSMTVPEPGGLALLGLGLLGTVLTRRLPR